MCCVGPATFAGTVLAHRTRRNAGDGVPYAACWIAFHNAGSRSNTHVIPRAKPVGISWHRSAECYVPAGDCHVALRLLAMTEVVGSWFHRCVAAVPHHLRARCLRTAPDGTPGTAFPTPRVDWRFKNRTSFQQVCHSEGEARGNLPAPQCEQLHSRRRLPRPHGLAMTRLLAAGLIDILRRSGHVAWDGSPRCPVGLLLQLTKN